METWQWGIVLKPLVLFVVLAAIYPARVLTRRYMPEGKLKRALLWRYSDWRPRRWVLWLIWLPIVGFIAFGIGVELGRLL